MTLLKSIPPRSILVPFVLPLCPHRSNQRLRRVPLDDAGNVNINVTHPNWKRTV